MSNEKTPHDKSIFCDNIRLLRQRHHLSKRKMSKILQIGVPTLNKLEQGILPRCVRVNTLFPIYDVFGLTAEDIFRPFSDQ